MYEEIPTILNPTELLNKALGRSSKILKEDKAPFHRARKTTLARIESTRDLLVDTLDGYVKRFPALDRVDTFERELVDILVGVDALRTNLGRISGVTETARRLSDRALKEIRTTHIIDEVVDVRRRLVGRLSSLIEQLDEPLAFLAKAREMFRRIPHVTPGDVTVVVAGYPNVGKSSIMAALTNAHPEIAPYAFTTKHMNIGHFLEPGVNPLRARRYQLVDTPGLLDKPGRERNAIEKQAALALKHLADVIVFVIDPSETCGYTRDEQQRLLASIRTEFEGIPLLLVENKADLGAKATAGASLVSCTTGQGLDDLRRLIVASTPHDPFRDLLAQDGLPEN